MNSLTDEEQADVRILGRYLNHLVNVRDGQQDESRSWYTQVMDDQLQALQLQRAEALALRGRGASQTERQSAARAPPDHYPIPQRNASNRSAPREERPSRRPQEEESPAEPATSAVSSFLDPLALGALAVGGLVGGALWLGSNLWNATEPRAEAARAPEQLQQEQQPESSRREVDATDSAEEEQHRQRRLQMQLEADMMLARRLQREEEEELRQSVRVQPESRRSGGRSGGNGGAPAASHGDRQLNRGAGTPRQRQQQQQREDARPSEASRAAQQRNAGHRRGPEDPMAQFLQALASSSGRGHSRQLLADSAAPLLEDDGIEIREIVGPGGRRQIMLQMRRPGGAPGANGGGGGGLQELDRPLGGAFRGGMLNLDALTYEQLSQLEAAMGEEPRGISPDVIERLPTRTYHRRPSQGQSTDGAVREHDQCSVCLSEYEEGDSVRTLPCLHCYHVGCIDNWLQRSKSCPVCKHDVDVAQ